jgi:hypothetical protein
MPSKEQHQLAREQIRTSANYLADRCLENSEWHYHYEPEDLQNATLIFSHFLMDLMYTRSQHLPPEKQLELAETTGKAIRQLVLDTTDIDMHDFAKKERDAE